MIKIWGTSFSLIGDLIMSLPQLVYFKKKYKNSYINFVIHKKISYCAPLFFNHPDIDKIRISGEWSSFNSNDFKVASECDIITTKLDLKNKKILNRQHDNKHWYNHRSCIDETALMSGITDLNETLTSKEKIPYLQKWFDPGFEVEQKKAAYTYDKVESKRNKILSKSLAIWPFAGYGRSKNRNPSEEWWSRLVSRLTDNSISVYHFGYFKEPKLSENKKYYHNLTDLDFFNQIKISLGSKLAIGTDSGSMWVLAAYNHPMIILGTNWYDNHTDNLNATIPPIESGECIFNQNNFLNLDINEIYDKILFYGVKSENFIDKILKF
jgi:ADP-heptose:LPS heptosyltransferase